MLNVCTQMLHAVGLQEPGLFERGGLSRKVPPPGNAQGSADTDVALAPSAGRPGVWRVQSREGSWYPQLFQPEAEKELSGW